MLGAWCLVLGAWCGGRGEHEEEGAEEEEEAAERDGGQADVLDALQDREVERPARMRIDELFVGTLVDPPAAGDERMVDGNRDLAARGAVGLDFGAARVLPHGAGVGPVVDREVAHREVETLRRLAFRHAAGLARAEAQIAIVGPAAGVVDPAAEHEREAEMQAERGHLPPGADGGERAPRGADAQRRDGETARHPRARTRRARAGERHGGDRAHEQRGRRRAASRQGVPVARHEASAPVRSRAAAKLWRAQ